MVRDPEVYPRSLSFGQSHRGDTEYPHHCVCIHWTPLCIFFTAAVEGVRFLQRTFRHPGCPFESAGDAHQRTLQPFVCVLYPLVFIAVCLVGRTAGICEEGCASDSLCDMDFFYALIL